MTRQSIEKTGPQFSIEMMRLARQKTWAAVEEIRSHLKPGLLESKAAEIAEDVLTSMGVTRKWHRSWIRFGKNTLLQYGVLGAPGIFLQENDICFLDLGPIFDGIEGDCGKTFVFGDDSEMRRCASDVETLFHTTKEKWKNENLSGKALYQFAEKQAKALGWVLNLDGANGHRLCDFPHALHHKGPIADLDFAPSEYLWVLEMQIRHPEKPFGAFYEDLLVND